MIKFGIQVIYAHLYDYIGKRDKDKNLTQKVYVAGWSDCLKYLASNFNVDVVVEEDSSANVN